MDQIHKKCAELEDLTVLRQQTSMGTLISWNIAKAIEANPNIDLKLAIQAMQQRLENDARDVSSLVSQNPEEQYLACALLAWQQLGHSEADSLHQFVETKQNQSRQPDLMSSVEFNVLPKRPALSPGSFISYEDSMFSKGVGSSNYDTYSLVGPVVKLPVETKIIMRVDNNTTGPQRPVRPQPTKRAPEKELMNKIDAACCMESACMEKLTQLDKSTNELRKRAQRLARREAERVELLERAEAAWKDLELGYQRRLAMAEEKEEDMAKHIKKLIEERNNYKTACTNLAQQLRERGEIAEKERAKLTTVEKEVCENACMRLRVSEEAARLDATLAEQQCKATQLDRDLQFKEEQIRRKLQTMESELESARCLTHEAERALHAELCALRQQITQVSNQLLGEDAENCQIKEELDALRQEKLEIIEDLDGCNAVCTSRIQKKMDALKTKREQLKELKERVMECQCKLPVDASVEAKRTPSLAALCKCSPEDKYLDSCSCTSLRSSLLTNLLADLFGGLQAELGGCGSQMPCQLLKCLEDRHNWDKTSIIKTNLRNYFSQLLIGELDIAISTSIEKYHAKWVGASCADAARMIPDRGGPETEGWQERALERRAQKLAAKLAEQLFQERADQLTAKAKEVIRTGPPPCECKPRAAAVYPVLVKQPLMGSQAAANTTTSGAACAATTPAYWRRTHQDMTQLRVQLEDLRKDSIRKEDLKVMEENIVKMVQRATVTDDIIMEPDKENLRKNSNRKDNNIHRPLNTEQGGKNNVGPKLTSIKKKQSDLNPKKGSKNFILGLQIDKPVRSYKKIGRSYAVNLCLCGSNKETKQVFKTSKHDPPDVHDGENKKNVRGMSNMNSQIFSGKHNKSVASRKLSHESSSARKIKTSVRPLCRSDVMCFHKPPSNTSIDKLLETLVKWKCDLSKIDDTCRKNQSILGIAETGNKLDIITNKESDKKKYEHIPIKVSKNLSALPFKSNVIVANFSKSVETPCIIPVTTESEYMGAVNLDGVDSGNRGPGSEENCNVLNCKHSIECNYKTFDKEQAFKNSPDTNSRSLNKEVIKNDKSLINSKTNTEASNKIIQKEEHKQIKQITESPSFASDCQYCIKFLGVTLTNANSKKNLPDKDKARNQHYVSTSKKSKRGNYHPEVWYSNVNSHKPRVPVCDCSLKYDEVKDLLTGVVAKQHGDYNKNHDKSLDTQSFQKKHEEEGCVCCEEKLNESKELEVNAFHLLEEHLRGKLQEFKSSNCKSSCITPEEEEKLFSTILQRVKQIITENTSGITCKCAPEEITEGSWHRAYMLLEEYLKIKIKKVQCVCLTPENTNETILPNVLEKVCTLIDNDFKRLREVCKCTNDVNKKDMRFKTEVPEKDIISLTNYDQLDYPNTSNETQQPETITKEVSNNSIVVTQNTSSQISPNLDVSTKYCDAIEINTQNEQTSPLISNKCCKVTEINYDGSFCMHSTKITKSYMKLFGSNDVFINQCSNIQAEIKDTLKHQDFKDAKQLNVSNAIDPVSDNTLTVIKNQTVHCSVSKQTLAEVNNLNKIDLQNKIPYIGYTVDCSCNGLLGKCTCTKSLINGQNDINSIWNTLTSNKLHRNNISYIMDAVPNKHNAKNTIAMEQKNIEEINKTNDMLVNGTTCDSKIGTEYIDDIILKDSTERLNKHFMSTTTSGDDICYSPEWCEPIEWCDSSHAKEKGQNKDVCEETCDGSMYYPVRNFVSRGKNASLLKSDPINLPSSFSSNCDCNMVPMCHVKMLVENIENKLINAKCTCDSLCAKICPIHSKKQ